MAKSNNVFDYLDWRGDLTLAQSPFNEIDALILSLFSYLDFHHIDGNEVRFFKDAVLTGSAKTKQMKKEGPLMIMESVINLADQAAQCPRFQDIGVTHFEEITDHEQEMQFSAVTFLLPDKTAFVSFRGTDNSLVGWKEDFNMSFTTAGVPAQLAAARYAEDITYIHDLPLRLGGHSKGGNLAIWAGTHLPYSCRENILAIYSNDGPGFREGFLTGESYISIRDKIQSYVPESSIVGVLMEHDDYTTIQSTNASLLQHDPFSWSVLGTHFITKDTRSRSGRAFEKAINSWMQSMEPSEREALVENIYSIISSSNARTLKDLDSSKLKSFISMRKTFMEMEPETRKQITHSLAKLLFPEEDDKSERKLLALFTGEK